MYDPGPGIYLISVYTLLDERGEFILKQRE